MDSILSIEKGIITLENCFFRYQIATDGRNIGFTEKVSGTDYLDKNRRSVCSSVIKNGKYYPVSAVSVERDHLKFEFNEVAVTAQILVKSEKDQITMEVIKVTGEPESITFLDIPLILEGIPSESFAACVLSMNLTTHVPFLPALQKQLRANCYKRFGMEGAKVVLLGVPMKNILPEIRNAIKDCRDFPCSEAGGAWAQMSEKGNGSYLFNFGTLTEETVDEWIERCTSVGFNQIDSHGGKPDFFKFGSFEFNPEKWPEGWNHFKRINSRLHEAGISSIFHTYAFFIDKKSKYATPVPHPDLAYFRSFTLAEPLNTEDSIIVVKESTENISITTGFFVQNSRILRIGDELIEFSGATKSAPYKFTGCKRGFNGTKATTIQPNEKVYHLKEMFGLFVPDPESNLFTEIARNHADVVNENGFDGIYLDAIDGSSILDGPENSWYYSTKFVVEIARNLKRPVGMEMSSMEHLYWHYRSRWQAWDTPNRGFKKFIDIHSSSISGGLLLPLQLGWWRNYTWKPPVVEPTFTDDIEYMCCKMIGNDAGLALLGGVDKKEVEINPSFKRLNAIIKKYEVLRHKNYFSDSIRALLRQPGKDFTLFEESGAWNFKPIAFQKHKVAGINHPSSSWTVNNEFDNQPVRLRIEPLMSVKPSNDPKGIILTGFSNTNEFAQTGNAPGVSGRFTPATEKTPDGDKPVLF